VIVQVTGRESGEFSDFIALAKGRSLPVGNPAAAYICQGNSCHPPVFTDEELETYFIAGTKDIA
jgi:uncharacterized protein YyaL (SSP411 family)